jgi:hypothetical protein
MAKGLYRDAVFVYVSYDGADSVPISHALYRERGYKPLLDRLPTKAKYDALRPG